MHEDTQSTTFGRLLQEYRLRTGLTQEALAELAGVGRRSIQGLERGENVPHRGTLQRLIQALALSSPEQAHFEAAARPSPRRHRSGAKSLASGDLSSVPQSEEASRNNLPTQLTSFIGRKRETAAVEDLLAETRLLTLIGTGGCGKTRLALHVAGDFVDSFSDGVWMVELASLADPELVPAVLAKTLGVPERPGQPIQAALLFLLRMRHLLLILDNCEHLIDACAQLVHSILRHCPRVRILATSRESLRIDGEVTWRVPSLTLDTVERPVDGTEELASEAGQLFVSRARTARSDFVVGDGQATVIGQICRRLDGIPLAIELAASCVNVLSVEQIAARLDQRFLLLTGGSRVAVPRHQTLAALIDWSYDLLSEAERTLFHRLSVFVGGFTLEAAQVIGGDVGLGANLSSNPRTLPAVPAHQVLTFLTGLVEKSLAIAEQGPGPHMRYRLLETLRQYGQERLAASGEVETIGESHAAYYRGMALAAEPHLLEAGQLVHLAHLDPETDNVRAALRWFLDHSRVWEGVRFNLTLLYFWWFRGRITEFHAWIDRFLALPAAAERTVLRALALEWSGHGAAMRGDHSTFRKRSEESIALAREVGDRCVLAETLLRYGHFIDHHMAREPLEESLAIWRELAERWKVAECLTLLGEVEVVVGNPAKARRNFHESLTIARSIGERHQLAYVLEIFGGFEIFANLGHAIGYLTESQSLYRELGDAMGVTSIEGLLGWLAYRNGRDQVATDHFRASLRSSAEWLWVERITYCIEGLVVVAARRGQFRRALRLAGASSHMRDLASIPLTPRECADLELALELIRRVQGDEQANVAWAEGQAMTLEQSVAYALDEEDAEESVGITTPLPKW